MPEFWSEYFSYPWNVVVSGVVAAVLLLGFISVSAFLAIWAERKLGNAAEFPLGLLVGEMAVLATVALNGMVLLEGGDIDLRLALILVLIHLPIAVIEGVVMGFTVGFLARVRPDILGLPSQRKLTIDNCQLPNANCPEKSHSAQLVIANCQLSIVNSASDKVSKPKSLPPVLLLAILSFFGLAGPAKAHRLEGEYRILPGQKVRIESWFDLTGESPAEASVQVFRENGEVLAKGTLDKQGVFVFSFSRAEPLRVVIAAGAGHRKELSIPLTDLAGSLTGLSKPQDPSPADRSTRISIKDVLMGIGFVLALAAFFWSWRNARRLREIRVTLSPPETPLPDQPPTDPDRR